MHKPIRLLLCTGIALVALVFTAICYAQAYSGQVEGNVYIYVNDGGYVRTIGTYTVGGSGKHAAWYDDYFQAYNHLWEKQNEGYATNIYTTWGNCYDRFGQPCKERF